MKIPHSVTSALALGGALALLALASRCATSPPPPEPKLNVLFITMDTTRADRLGCYGYALNTTPGLDRLADDAILFSNATAQSSVTNTSHASMFTGLNPYRHGVRFLLDKRLAVLRNEHDTIAELFRRSGASTAAFVSAVPASSEFGLDQGFDHFDEAFERDGRVNQRRGDETADAAIEWLSGVEEPYFGWVHFFDPHDPKLVPPGEILDRFKPAKLNDRDVAARAIYDAEVHYMDMQIQRLLDTLTRRNLSDRTIVVVVSDHGEGLGDHDWWHHGIIYQEQVRVPMILRKPGGPSGLQVDAMVRTIDLMPTLLKWAGIDPSLHPDMEGRDLSPLLDGPNVELVEFAYCDSTNMQSYMHFGDTKIKSDKLYCVRDERWKLIYHQLRPDDGELYDLRADAAEAVNLYDVETDVRDRLVAELMRRNAMIDEISGVKSVSPELLRRLKSLGYSE